MAVGGGTDQTGDVYTARGGVAASRPNKSGWSMAAAAAGGDGDCGCGDCGPGVADDVRSSSQRCRRGAK